MQLLQNSLFKKKIYLFFGNLVFNTLNFNLTLKKDD